MLRIAKLRDAEYVLEQVAGGLEDYYLGRGEAPGVWAGGLARQFGLAGVVEGPALRALIEGRDATSGTGLGLDPKRVVAAFDATFSAPKSVSLLWAFASAEVASVVSIAHVEAVAAALGFLEAKAALARQQTDGRRLRVETSGFAAATFVHRTSREGDPQLHSHCVIPNLVHRPDGSWATLDGGGLYHWAKAAGCIYQEELRRALSERLGVSWGPDRNGCRELAGFTEAQLRRFSKRAVQIEEHLAARGIEAADARARMHADEVASLATRRAKDPSLTPERLRECWAAEAAQVGLPTGRALERRLAEVPEPRWRPMTRADVDRLMAQLVDPEVGLCAHDSRFTEAKVIEAIAAFCAGDLTGTQIQALAEDFLHSDLVVRLVDRDPSGRTPPRWSTVAHRQAEDRVLDDLAKLVGRRGVAIAPVPLAKAMAAYPELGADQAEAVKVLCGDGPALRALIAPAGHGKTTAIVAAAEAAAREGRGVVSLASTNQAVAELARAGLAARTVASFALAQAKLPSSGILIVDELSQLPAAEAEVVLAAVARSPGSQCWLIGDPLQAQPVRAGGLAPVVARLAARGRIPAAELSVNRRQVDPTERAALARYREGEIEASQALRAAAGLEHHAASPELVQAAMAEAVVCAIGTHGAAAVAALAVSHAECEDLADRIRARLGEHGLIHGRILEGPGWAGPRRYQAGDRIMVHGPIDLGGGQRVANGITATVLSVSGAGLRVRPDLAGTALTIPAAVVGGRGPDGRPFLSHAWARTIDGVQGATFAQVHLLGTAALDRYRGYVGQSRSIAPTHTWNTRAPDPGDHGGHLVRSGRAAAAEVAAAMARTPTKTFAAGDDPNRLLRRLTDEEARHRAVLAERPPSYHQELKHAAEALARAERQLADDRQSLERWQAQLVASNRAGRLLPAGGRRHDEAKDRVATFRSRVEGQARAVDEHRHRLGELEAKAEACRRFDRTEAWRSDRIGDLYHQMARHWADAVVAAARAGDPYAYGAERFRWAIETLRQSQRVGVAPADRATSLERDERNLALLIEAKEARKAARGLAVRPARSATESRSLSYGGYDYDRHRNVDRGMGRGR